MRVFLLSFLVACSDVPDASTLVAYPRHALADGRQTITLTARIRDVNGVPHVDAPVMFTVSGDGNVLSEALAMTGLDGIATATLTSTTGESKTITATVSRTTTVSADVGFVAVPAACPIEFTAIPYLPHPENGPDYAIALADVDGDGQLDLARVSGTSAFMERGLNVHRGNGDGTFGPATNYATPKTAFSIVIADLDRDGLADAVVGQAIDASQLPVPLGVLVGRPDGTLGDFAAQMPSAGTTLAVVDLGRRGAPDIVALRSGGGFSVDATTGLLALVNAGDATFASVVTPSSGLADGVATGDFDGDGLVDLATVGFPDGLNAHPRELDLLRGNGDGTFRDAEHVDLGPGEPVAIAAADLDGNGTLDLVTANQDGKLHVYLGAGDGSFASAPLLDPHYGTNTTGSAVAIADLNRDGRLDIVTGNGVVVAIFLGVGSGQFAPATKYTTGQGIGVPLTHLAIGDLDGNGFLDIVAAEGVVLRQHCL